MRDRTVKPARLSRRELFRSGAVVAGGALACRSALAASPSTPAPIKLPNLLAPTERETTEIPAPLPPQDRVGVAVVGLGRLALEQILPAFAESKRCRLVALVSGDGAKAATVAAKYGVDSKNLYDYKTYDRLRDNAGVSFVYVVLPNGLHAEYTIRALQAGKHVLCEKPMANTVAECEQMIDAARKASRSLMIAYRMQYEPYNREVIRMARAGELGALKGFSAINGQTQGDPHQWRLKKALSGGGPLPDVGIYCLNAARYISGEEPIEVSGMMRTSPNDPRFTEVEEQVDFVMRFPSGLLASCSTSYGYHDAKRYRLLGSEGWVELDPAFPYRGQTMRIGRKRSSGNAEAIEQRQLEAKNQFALEMDHLAACVTNGQRPHTPGEEGLQDMRIISAIYEAARRGRAVGLPKVAGVDAFRGAAVI